MGKLELRWGAIIGGASLVWLYLSYYLGMHTNGLMWIQVMSVVGMFIFIVGFVFALRAIHAAYPEMTYREGLLSGVRVAGVVAVFALITQLGYFYVVHPGWTDYMVAETEARYRAMGLEGEDLESMIEAARTSFGLRSYLLQSSLSALFFGTITSAIAVAIIRRQRR